MVARVVGIVVEVVCLEPRLQRRDRAGIATFSYTASAGKMSLVAAFFAGPSSEHGLCVLFDV